MDFRRDLRFDRVFGYNFYAKLFSFTVTIVLAVVLRNYWALVAGILCGQLARTVLSYILHPYRPRISFAKMSEIWSFSIWTFVRSIGSYFITQVDVIAIGGVAGATSMGRYTVAKDVASSPTDEMVSPWFRCSFRSWRDTNLIPRNCAGFICARLDGRRSSGLRPVSGSRWWRRTWCTSCSGPNGFPSYR